MSQIELGDFRITVVTDGVYWWDGGAFFGVVPKTLWSPRIPNDELNRVPLALNCYVIQTGESTILIETGGGGKMDDRACERMRLGERLPLPERLSIAGIDPESITHVINSHLHWDHCGWNTQIAGDRAIPCFPRATYFTQRGEWEHAHTRHPRDSVSYIDANYDPLVDSGQMVLLEGDREILPGIRCHVAPGHNRNMMVITAESKGETFCFWSDLVPSAVHLKPTWVAGFDLYPAEAIDTKVRWLDLAAKEGWMCGFAHEVNLQFCKVASIKNSFEPAE